MFVVLLLETLILPREVGQCKMQYYLEQWRSTGCGDWRYSVDCGGDHGGASDKEKKTPISGCNWKRYNHALQLDLEIQLPKCDSNNDV